MPPRPSNKEIFNKVRDGLAAVCAEQRRFASPKHFAADLDALELTSANDYWQLIEKLLGEILTAGPVACYAGGRPPKRSYEAGIKNAELWAYAWDSPSLGKRMYLKFVLENEWYLHVDCHESTEK